MIASIINQIVVQCKRDGIFGICHSGPESVNVIGKSGVGVELAGTAVSERG